jgi:hypothetical protein
MLQAGPAFIKLADAKRREVEANQSWGSGL